MKFTLGKLLLLLMLGGTIAAAFFALNPVPIAVDAITVTQGHLEVTVDEDGKTRVRDRYEVAAPLHGKLRRIGLRAGSRVTLGETVLAVIEPLDPALLDQRQRATTEARVKATESAVEQAGTVVRKGEAELEWAQTELNRNEKLLKTGGATQQQLEFSQNTFRTQTETLAAARFGLQISQFELQQAQAALLFSHAETASPEELRYDVVAPVNGLVLKVLQESAAVVQPGSPLLELGDTTDLEIEVDVLSTDAVRIQLGARVLIDHWGGEAPLAGAVQLIEPSGFTRISALGVEEQRVNVIIRFDAPLESRQRLGDGFRVETHIVVWEAGDVLKIPTSALFREGTDWAVFVIEAGIAQRRRIEIGERNQLEAQVISGLTAGMQVIEHPADSIQPGTQVIPRVN